MTCASSAVPPTDHFAATSQGAEICTLHHDDQRDYLLRFPRLPYKKLETLSSRIKSTERQLSIFAGEDTTFVQVIELVEEAQDSKPGVQRFLDRFAQI